MSMVQVATADGVTDLCIDRPERRNALIGPVVEELLEAVRSTRSESSVLLLRGEGAHLCAGLDVDAFNSDPPPEWKAEFSRRWADLHKELWGDDRPLVVAHTGGAVGAGAALLFAADVAISGRTAFAHVLETAIGMLAPINIAWLMARHSSNVATELALLAERVGAESLYRRGLITEVVADHEVLERARDRALRLAGLPSPAIAATRRVVRELSGANLPEMIDSAQTHGAGLSGPRRPT